jgi:hypothetical protein
MDRLGLCILEQELKADAAVMAEAARLAAERLLERVSLELPAIRPRFLPAEHRSQVRKLTSFRHFFRHAYDPILRADRLAELLGHARTISAAFPDWTGVFCSAILADPDR